MRRKIQIKELGRRRKTRSLLITSKSMVKVAGAHFHKRQVNLIWTDELEFSFMTRLFIYLFKFFC